MMGSLRPPQNLRLNVRVFKNRHGPNSDDATSGGDGVRVGGS